MCNAGLKINKTMEIFKHRKNNDRYQDRAKLFLQIMEKIQPIVEALYLGGFILFKFDNSTSYFIYVEDALCAYKINKKPNKK